MATVRQSISYWTRALRAGAGMTQAELAGRLGLHRPAVSEIEAGRRGARVEEVAQMAKIFGVSFEKFLEEPPRPAGGP